jgi:hypothetical protein
VGFMSTRDGRRGGSFSTPSWLTILGDVLKSGGHPGREPTRLCSSRKPRGTPSTS